LDQSHSARRKTKRKMRPRMLATMTPTSWPRERLAAVSVGVDVGSALEVVSVGARGLEDRDVVVVSEDVVGIAEVVGDVVVMMEGIAVWVVGSGVGVGVR